MSIQLKLFEHAERRSRIISDLRLNRLISSLQQNQRECISTLIDCGLMAEAKSTLKKMINTNTICDTELNTLIYIIKHPKPPNNPKQTPMKELQQKATKILIKNNKLKNNSKFRLRDNMGKLGILQLDIGNDINELSLKDMSESEINSLTQQWAVLHQKVNKILMDINKEDHNEGLMKFSLNSFVKKIDDENKQKKLIFAQEKKRKKNRIVLSDKTNTNNNKNSKNENDKNNKKKQIANQKSHLMRQQFSKFVDFEDFLSKTEVELKQCKLDIIQIAKDFDIIDDENKCNQEDRWVAPFNNGITVDFVGKKAFNRYRNELKLIDNTYKILNDKKKDLQTLMNEAIWRKKGKCRGTKTFRERVNDYRNRKDKINKKNQGNKAKKDKSNTANKKRKNMDEESVEANIEDERKPPPIKKQRVERDISQYFCAK